MCYRHSTIISDSRHTRAPYSLISSFCKAEKTNFSFSCHLTEMHQYSELIPPYWVEDECASSIDKSACSQVRANDQPLKGIGKLKTLSDSASEGTTSTVDETISAAGNPDEPFCHSKIKFDIQATVIHFVKPRHEMTPDEFNGTWYRTSDFTRISSWNRMTVKLMRQNGSLEGEPDHCIRGLEHRLKGQQKLRQTLKTNAIYAVLNEQARQREYGVNPERLCDVYRGYTYSCVQEALARGIEDERTLQEVSDLPCSKAQTEERNRRRSTILFDEDDLTELRVLMDSQGEDEIDPSEELKPSTASMERDTTGYSKETNQEKKKHSKLSRFSRFFKKKEEGKGTRSQDPPQRRKYRRSSM